MFSILGGVLQYTCDLDSRLQEVTDMKVISAPDLMLFGIKPFNSVDLHLWNISNGELMQGFELPSGSHFYQTGNGDYICTFNKNRTLQTFKLDSGEMIGEVLICNFNNTNTIFVDFFRWLTHNCVVQDLNLLEILLCM